MKSSIRSQSAFTLIEILAVLLIVVFIFSLSGRMLFSREKKIRAVFQDLILLNRRLVMDAKTRRNVYRLALRLNPEGPEEYWVEKKEASEEGSGDFALDERFFSPPQKISPLLEISSVESVSWEEPKTEGIIHIYYTPKGLAQETAIQFFRPDNKGRWTLYLHPVHKEFHLLANEKSLQEIKGLL